MAGHPRQGVAAALETERGLRQLPALAHLANDVLAGYSDIVEEDFGELGVAGDLLERPHLHARTGHVQDEVRDAPILGRVRVWASQQHPVVGVWGEAGPDFLAADDPVAAVAYRAGLQAGQVRARVWLGIQLAPDLLGRQHAREVALLL